MHHVKLFGCVHCRLQAGLQVLGFLTPRSIDSLLQEQLRGPCTQHSTRIVGLPLSDCHYLTVSPLLTRTHQNGPRHASDETQAFRHRTCPGPSGMPQLPSCTAPCSSVHPQPPMQTAWLTASVPPHTPESYHPHCQLLLPSSCLRTYGVDAACTEIGLGCTAISQLQSS